jgi:inositol 1,4,5-triphosphate receptor type 1
VRLDYRLTCLLSIFKNSYEKNYEKIFDPELNMMSVNETFNSIFLSECEKVFQDSVSSESIASNDLDLDGVGGKKFLRVLLKLIMHDYPQLVNGSLKLLHRHFNQVQETLIAIQQVC